MAHIHTNPGEHDLTVSAFIVRTDFDEPKIMLHMHKKLGKWLQFGGHVELSENPWQALAHEILEESGYDMDQLKLIEIAESPAVGDATAHPIPFSVNTHAFSDTHDHIDLSYAFTNSEEPRHPINSQESDTFQCFSQEELIALPTELIPKNARLLCNFVLAKLI